MRNWLLLFLVVFPFSAFSQEADTAAVARQVDSLLEVSRRFCDESKLDSARAGVEAAEKIVLKEWGKGSLAYGDVCFHYGRVSYFLEKYAEAELSWLEALDIREKLLGKEHPDYAKSLNNLGFLYRKTGDAEKAEKLYLEARAIRKKALGEEHPDYLISLDNLADLYNETGRYEKAVPVYLEDLAIREKFFGKENPEYCGSLINLALTYNNIGQYKKAEPLLLEAKTIFEAGLNDTEHPYYVNGLSILANLYSITGQFAKAEPLLLDVLAIRKRKSGEAHPLYCGSLINLAILYKNLGQYEKAEQLLLEARHIFEDKLNNTEHPYYANGLNNLAILYHAIGQYEKAEPILLDVLTFMEKQPGKGHPRYWGSLANLANLYYGMGQYEKAEPIYLEANSFFEVELNNREHAYYINGLHNLADLYRNIGNYEKAEALYLEARDIREKTLGKAHFRYAESLNALALLYLEMGRYEQSETFLLEALDIDEKALGKDHPNYAGNLHSLANLYRAMERYEKAEALYLEVGAILKKAFGEAHPEYARSLANLAAVYESTGRYEKAERLYLDVKAIWSNALGELHPYYARSLYSLAALYWMLGDDEKAALFFEQASAIERILLVRASHHLSEREMAAYANTFAQRQGLSLSFTHSKRRLAKSNYDDALFYKGFLLNATQHVGRLAVAEPASRDIYHRLKGYHRRLAAEYAKPVAERQNTGELEEKANALEKELARTVAGFGEALRQVTWQEVQAALQEGEAAVEFIHYQYHGPAPADSILYAAFVLRPGDEQPHFVPLFEEKMLGSLFPSKDEAQAGTFLTQAYASRGITPTPRNDYPNLYELVWQPLDSLLAGAKTVYASPSGLLHRINLGAVMTDSSLPFVSFHRLVRLNSTRQLAFRNPQPAMANHQHPIFATLYGGIYYNMDSLAIAGANRDYGAGSNSLEAFSFVMLGEDRAEAEGEPEAWGPLPGAAEEVAKIAELLRVGGGQANVLAGFAATEESFKQLGRDKPSPRILHLATHGFFYPDPAEYRNSSPFGGGWEGAGGAFKLSHHPLIRSGLILAGGNHAWQGNRPPEGLEDGILTAYEVSQLDLRNTELVVLSACETGLGDIRGNEGVYGLQRAFQIAGADKVIMSLWAVPDEQAQEMMVNFYRYWLEAGMDIAEAFRAAQQKMREKYVKHYYWAAFVLVE